LNLSTINDKKKLGNDKKRLGSLTALLIILSCFTFPINQGIVVLAGLEDSTLFNITVRFMYLCLAIYLIAKNLLITKPSFSTGGLWFITFYAFYLIRVIYDLEVVGIIYQDKSNFLLYSFAIGTIFIPCIAVIMNSKFINTIQLSKFIFYALFLSNLSILLYVLKQGYSSDLFLKRSVIKLEDAESELLNAITVALFGELLALFALVCLFFLRNLIIKSNTILILALIIGLLCLILGASRGPLLSFVLIFTFLSLMYLKSRKSFFSKVFSSIFVVIAFSSIINYIVSLGEGQFFIIERMSRLNEEGDDTRESLYKNAWNQFLDNPIFGDCMVERTSSFYPHNLILEILMAMGLFGLTLFVPFIFILLKKGFQYIKVLNPFFLIYIILLPLFLSTVTSGSLIFSIDFFVFSSFILSSTERFTNNK
jgi:O-antigen ligase